MVTSKEELAWRMRDAVNAFLGCDRQSLVDIHRKGLTRTEEFTVIGIAESYRVSCARLKEQIYTVAKTAEQ